MSGEAQVGETEQDETRRAQLPGSHPSELVSVFLSSCSAVCHSHSQGRVRWVSCLATYTGLGTLVSNERENEQNSLS